MSTRNIISKKKDYTSIQETKQEIFRIKGIPVILYAPRDYWLLTEEEKDRICNGCGAQGKFDFIPDSIWFMSIEEVCSIHDFCYYSSRPCIEDKEEADRIFLNNMLRLIEAKTKWRWLKFLRRRRAYKYYLAVKYFGAPAFWVGKNKDENLGVVK